MRAGWRESRRAGWCELRARAPARVRAGIWALGLAGAIAVCSAPHVARAGAPNATTATASSSALTASDGLLDEDFDAEIETDLPDPLEPVNRRVFGFNRFVDRLALDPVTRFYGRVVPDPVKRSVQRFFDNLNEPVVIVNDLLQLEGRRAATATGRFLLNSTFGCAGLFDPAIEAGWYAHAADFGQTLGKAGVPPGLYLMFPLLGPSTARDAVGSLVDMALRPDAWLLPMGPRVLIGGTWGLSEREENLRSLEALEHSSIDFYASLRSAYWMHRQAMVRDEEQPAVAKGASTPLEEEGAAGEPGAERRMPAGDERRMPAGD